MPKSKSQRPGPDSPYMKRRRAQDRPRPRREQEDYQALRDFHHDFRAAHGGRCASDPPPGADKFYRLPPHLRPQAYAYYNSLAKKWASRIKRTPGFARILHMITLNRFKNPNQVLLAGMRGSGILRNRKSKMRKIYEDPEPSRTPAQVRHLPTF